MMTMSTEATTQNTTEPSEKLTIVLDIEHDEGAIWLSNWGRVNSDGEPVIHESLEGRTRCEQCRDERICYLLDGALGAVPVCRECLQNCEWVAEIRETDR